MNIRCTIAFTAATPDGRTSAQTVTTTAIPHQSNFDNSPKNLRGDIPNEASNSANFNIAVGAFPAPNVPTINNSPHNLNNLVLNGP